MLLQDVFYISQHTRQNSTDPVPSSTDGNRAADSSEDFRSLYKTLVKKIKMCKLI